MGTTLTAASGDNGDAILDRKCVHASLGRLALEPSGGLVSFNDLQLLPLTSPSIIRSDRYGDNVVCEANADRYGVGCSITTPWMR